MYSIDSIDGFDLSIACIVLIGYISGKLWMYYRIENKENTKKDRVIRRGTEWPD
jgi:hypothetical protein